MNLTRTVTAGVFLLASTISHLSFAQRLPERVEMREGRDDWFNSSIYVAPAYVDNATSVVDDAEGEDKVEEFQIRSGFNVDAQAHSQLSNMNIDYQVEHRRFTDNSQEDETLANGESELRLGQSTSYLRLEANHSIRRILDAPDSSSIDLSSSQNRQIASLSPILQLRLGRRSSIELTHTTQAVRFSDDEERDSDRTTIEIALHRRLSATHEISLIMQNRDVTFPEIDREYSSDSAYIQIRGQHRRSWYQLRYGQTQLTQDSLKEDSNSYFASFGLDISNSQLQVFASQDVTDSSLGNANDELFADGIGYDGGDSVLDILTRNTAGVSWENRWLCQLCRLRVQLSHEQMDYLNFTEESYKEDTAGVNFVYSFSRNFATELFYRNEQTRFLDPSVANRDLDRDTYGLAFDYRLKDASVRLMYDSEFRDTDQNSLKIQTVELIFTWEF